MNGKRQNEKAVGGEAESAPGERTPPHSREAEMGVLGGLLISFEQARANFARVKEDGLRAEMFFSAKHGRIFEAMEALFAAGMELDDISVLEQIRANGCEEEAGGYAALSEIQAMVETPASLAYFTRIVVERWKQRQMIRQGRRLVELASVPQAFDELRKSVQEPLTALGDLSVNEVRLDVLAEMDALIERKKAEFAGEAEEVPEPFRLSLGMPHNEELLGYIDRRDTDNFIVVGAPSSRGKSTLMRQIIRRNLQLHPDWNVLVFVLEGGGSKYVHHMACGQAMVPNKKHWQWMSGQVAKGSEAARLANDRARHYFECLDFYRCALNRRLFVFERDRSIDDVVSRAREMEARLGRIDLVVVDYIQQIQSTKPNANREQQVSEVSNKLQSLQVSLRAPMVTGSQLNTEGEARESKAIFNDATRFLRIARPKEDGNGVDQTELGRKQYLQTIEQIKNRNGETALARYNFNCECGAFLDFHGIPKEKRGRPKKESDDGAVDL